MTKVGIFLQNIISEHQEWKTKEFLYIKTISIKLTDEEKKFFLASSISMIYSHWEGFVKKIIKELFKYIDQKKINNENLSDNLIIFSLEKQLNSLIKSTQFEKKVKNTKLLLEEAKKEISLHDKELNMKSNLKDTVLIEIFQKIGLDENFYDENDLRELRKFVNIRNGISHGDKNSFVLSIDDIEKYIELITKLMDNLILSIEDFLERKKFLKV